MENLAKRHGAMDIPDGGYMVYHWGYGNEVLPCQQDLTTCEYLAGVYQQHDTSTMYSFILWYTLFGVGFVWFVLSSWWFRGHRGSVADRILVKLERVRRKWLLEDITFRWLFGRTTRLQVLILAILSGYLLIFSFVGIYYRSWYNPSPTTSKTRTPLGWWSNRVGILSYALTPLTVLLATRENLLTLLTGIPHTHFNFLHRWLGRIIFVQAMLHTIGWTVVEAWFYAPRPDVYVKFFGNMYAVFGCAAVFFICWLFVFSLRPVVMRTGYEFFKITHLIGAILYIGACWGHWDKLWCWMVASLALIALDQSIRLLRSLYLHSQGRDGEKGGFSGFTSAEASVQLLGEGDDLVVRLDFDHKQAAWKPGQHFHLCFSGLSIWQSHPFTVASVPDPARETQHHTYILRVRKGQTKQLAAVAGQERLAVILQGPYGTTHLDEGAKSILAVAGGTGVTFTLPIVITALRQVGSVDKVVEFVWAVRRARDLLWLETECGELKDLLKINHGLRIKVLITREVGECASSIGRSTLASKEIDIEKGLPAISAAPSPTSSTSENLQALLSSAHERFEVKFLGDRHPDVGSIVSDFMSRAHGRVQILGSGPEAMGADLTEVVAGAEERSAEGIGFYWDSRE